MRCLLDKVTARHIMESSQSRLDYTMGDLKWNRQHESNLQIRMIWLQLD
jgi:hypothetical protein